MADVWNEEVVSGGSVDWNSVPEEPSRGIQGDLQTTWEENWDDGPAEQTDDWNEGTEEEEEEEEVESSRRARLRTLTATIKGGLRRRLAHLRRHSAKDDLDDGWNDQDTADAAWSDDGVFTTNPTTSSRLTKLASNFRGLVKRSVPKLARSKAHSKDNERAPAPEVWGYVSPEEIEAERALAAHASKEAASEPLNFTDPLLSFPDVEGEDFLSRFLSKTRLIAIHLERKHKLAMFMLRLCQEACYEHVKMHAPRALTLLQINAADDIEFQYWFDIIDSLRWKEKIPKGRVLKGENPGYNDGLKMLRHTAEHRLDYDSKPIKYVVWHLEKLDDEPRRSELGSALEQVYRNECEVAARKEA
ncbi:MAG: hypothetical protein L6R42_005529 [Xanthoria sp. 1 TBL-2021]|nr:MAG: hypothetical protein L6R42_005529 [Xanthoria sp. 1 TBL-2021]